MLHLVLVCADVVLFLLPIRVGGPAAGERQRRSEFAFLTDLVARPGREVVVLR